MMSAKIHWNLVILFGVLCQGIIGTLTAKNIDVSSEFHVRQKRVINRGPLGERREYIRNVPYVVSVKQFRGNFSCVGVILTHHIVLTVAKCVMAEARTLKIYSGSAQAVLPRLGNAATHQVIDKRMHMSTHPYRRQDGIALVKVTPPFIFSGNTSHIEFYEGRVEPGMHGSVSGWGCNPEGYEPGTSRPHHLRTIIVPIISNFDCTITYVDTFPITDSDICTLDASGHQYCGVEDTGAPLAIDVNYNKYLLGIHLWNGGVVGRANPDVFLDLRYPEYKNWIHHTIPILEAGLPRN